MTEFFLHMIPPRATGQMRKVSSANGKPLLYDPPAVKDAKSKFINHLWKFRPETPYSEGVRLIVKWCFPRGRHRDGEYKVTRPDTDNLQKLFKDCMTKCGFWKDDALVCSEVVEKFWAEIPGISVVIIPISELPHETE